METGRSCSIIGVSKSHEIACWCCWLLCWLRRREEQRESEKERKRESVTQRRRSFFVGGRQSVDPRSPRTGSVHARCAERSQGSFPVLPGVLLRTRNLLETGGCGTLACRRQLEPAGCADLCPLNLVHVNTPPHAQPLLSAADGTTRYWCVIGVCAWSSQGGCASKHASETGQYRPNW